MLPMSCMAVSIRVRWGLLIMKYYYYMPSMVIIIEGHSCLLMRPKTYGCKLQTRNGIGADVPPPPAPADRGGHCDFAAGWQTLMILQLASRPSWFCSWLADPHDFAAGWQTLMILQLAGRPSWFL